MFWRKCLCILCSINNKSKLLFCSMRVGLFCAFVCILFVVRIYMDVCNIQHPWFTIPLLKLVCPSVHLIFLCSTYRSQVLRYFDEIWYADTILRTNTTENVSDWTTCSIVCHVTPYFQKSLYEWKTWTRCELINDRISRKWEKETFFFIIAVMLYNQIMENIE